MSNEFNQPKEEMHYFGDDDYYSAFIEQNPNNDEAYYWRGFHRSRAEQYEDACEDYTSAINIKPDNADYYAARGNLYVIWGKHKSKEAIDDYTRVIELAPSNDLLEEALAGRMSCYFHLDDIELGCADAEKILTFTTDVHLRVNTLLRRGNIRMGQNNFELAINDFTVAIKIKTDFPLLYECRAFAYIELEEYEKALEDAKLAEQHMSEEYKFKYQQFQKYINKLIEETKN